MEFESEYLIVLKKANCSDCKDKVKDFIALFLGFPPFYFPIFNTLTPRVKPLVIQSLPTFDSMDRAVEQLLSCGAVSISSHLVCNFGKVSNFGLGAVGIERVIILDKLSKSNHSNSINLPMDVC